MTSGFVNAVDNIKQRLRDFAVADSSAPDLVWEAGAIRSSVDRNLFPVPNLILFVLHKLCSFPLGYRGDKTHWIVPFTYRGLNCAISHEKLGIRLYTAKDGNMEVKKNELLGKLKKAVESAEKHILAEVAEEQIKSGNITIANQFHRLGNQYAYFRERAESAHLPISQNATNDAIEGMANLLSHRFQVSAEGAYNALAMIDAYFSRLEHLLVLTLPFCSYERKQDDLTDFVGKIWSEKMKRVLNIEELPMHEYYDRLVNVKEKYRNTFAHGGFEKKGASFYFHLPHFGAIPASMSGHKNSVHFNLFPIETDTFNEICSLFDEVDKWFKATGIPLAWRFAESGLDLRFDEENISEMLAAASDPALFDEWLDKKSYFSDMYSNADY